MTTYKNEKSDLVHVDSGLQGVVQGRQYYCGGNGPEEVTDCHVLA